MEGGSLRGGSPNGFAVAPDGQRFCPAAMVLNHFGHGIDQGLHGFVRE